MHALYCAVPYPTALSCPVLEWIDAFGGSPKAYRSASDAKHAPKTAKNRHPEDDEPLLKATATTAHVVEIKQGPLKKRISGRYNCMSQG